MPRYAISQIFTSNIPHHQSFQQDTMISTLQPSRPRLSTTQSTAPLNQQPTRPISSTSTPLVTYFPPRTQMEAMPPLPMPMPLPATFSRELVRLDSSVRHPVFFTERLKKAPVGVNAGGGSWSSPVALGYVYNDGVKRSTVGGVNL